MDLNYSVTIEKFAQNHFIKKFQKKYKNKWDITLGAITAECSRLDQFLKTDKAEIISAIKDIKIIKTKFKIAGTDQASKTSGNRCILSACDDDLQVNILLIYHKSDLKGTNETIAWKQLIGNNYAKFRNLL